MLGKITVTWEARAIYTGQQVDLLPDRQSWYVPGILSKEPAFKEHVDRLAQWIDEKGLPFLCKKAEGLDPAECRVVAMNDGPYHIEASPESSCGYLYIRAWEAKPEANAFEVVAMRKLVSP
jgi:hypothetical protein